MSDYSAYAIPAPERTLEAWREWEAHLDAGRIGRRTHTPPEAARNLARWDALFRAGGVR